MHAQFGMGNCLTLKDPAILYIATPAFVFAHLFAAAARSFPSLSLTGMDETIIFVTGATGFIGSHVVDAALKAGYGV